MPLVSQQSSSLPLLSRIMCHVKANTWSCVWTELCMCCWLAGQLVVVPGERFGHLSVCLAGWLSSLLDLTEKSAFDFNPPPQKTSAVCCLCIKTVYSLSLHTFAWPKGLWSCIWYWDSTHYMKVIFFKWLRLLYMWKPHMWSSYTVIIVVQVLARTVQNVEVCAHYLHYHILLPYTTTNFFLTYL